MRAYVSRHGCFVALLALNVLLESGVQGAEPNPNPITTRVFDIEYKINEDALPLQSVELWNTLDGGISWQQYGYDSDRQSPFTFHADKEGLHGFFFIATNAAGASSAPPSRGVQPHKTAFVDYTQPVVQLHALRQATSLGQRVLQIRWTAIDSNFAARPVRLTYRIVPNGQWRAVTKDPLANTGKYDWRFPNSLAGRIAVQVTVVDQGGHRADSVPGVTDILLQAERTAQLADLTATPGWGGSDDTADRAISQRKTFEETRASNLFSEGLALRAQGRYKDAVSKIRQAVRLDSQLTPAFSELGDLLYLLGDFDRSLSAYDIAIGQDPKLRSGLQGSAKVLRQKNNYSAAAERLRTILRYNPKDAEVWMNLGDIAVYQGDEILARDSYLRATKIDPSATNVIDEAQKRLALMEKVSRTYRP